MPKWTDVLHFDEIFERKESPHVVQKFYLIFDSTLFLILEALFCSNIIKLIGKDIKHYHGLFWLS
jgi:hypothetical protein